MEKEPQKWLRIEDEGWQIVIPESDIQPHAMISKEEAEKLKTNRDTKLDVAGISCPCKPEVDYLDQIIVHNSFENMEKIDKKMNEIF